MTHQAQVNFFTHGARCCTYIVFLASMSALFFVCVTDGRTDTMCENHDHLFGRGLVGQCQGYNSISKI